MLKCIAKIIMMPVLFLIRLMLGTTAFIVSISSAIVGLGTGLFILLACVEFFIGYWQNGLALLAIALLVSPIGLPAIAEFILNKLGGACTFIEAKLC